MLGNIRCAFKNDCHSALLSLGLPALDLLSSIGKRDSVERTDRHVSTLPANRHVAEYLGRVTHVADQKIQTVVNPMSAEGRRKGLQSPCGHAGHQVYP